MALIKCSECGREVSSMASACPHCGAPISAINGCTVHFERKKVAFFGAALNGTVIVDGKEVGSASNGASFDVQLSYGDHSVVFRTIGTGMMGAARDNVEKLTIPSGAKRVIVTMKANGWDAKTAITGIAKIGIDDIQVLR